MKSFGIQIKDESETLSEFAVEENRKYVELYDWQRRAIKFFFDKNCESIFEVSTGAGKTHVAIEIIKRVWKTDPKCKVLIVTPKNVILEDTWYKSLYTAGISIKDIGAYYGAIKEYCPITITNMQSIDTMELSLFKFIIFDEIHNYCTNRLYPILERKVKYKLGLSATIEKMDGGHWKLLEIFNYSVFKFPPKQALDEGVLNPFKFINIGIELDDETEEIYERVTQNLNMILQAGGGFSRLMRTNSGLKFKMLKLMNERKELVNNYFRKFDVVRYVCNIHKENKILVFHQYNKQTSKTYWHLLDEGIHARVIHSGISKEKRDEVLKDFKNDKFNCLLATKVLDEGYNLPSIDVGIITAGDSTAKQTIQRLGRVLRKKENESTLYQIFCLRTIEEEHAIERAKLFKQLASNYEEWKYDGEEIIK